jgi:DNA-binding response OmpR family regulator
VRIALLEDDAQQAQLVSLWLEAAGHACQHFESGKSFIKNVSHDSFDLLLLDWNLPDIDGDEVLSWVRQRVDWHIPVLFVTSRDSEEDIVHVLERGADDYMVKPIRRGELIARVAALARRAQGTPKDHEKIETGDLTLDLVHRSISRGGEAIELTGKEFDLALFLIKNTGRILSRGHILESVWGRSPDINTRTVDTHVSRIRKKLDLNPERGWRLSAIYQHGYRLERIDRGTGEAVPEPTG